MVEELLDFSRLQNGIKLQCQVLDLVAEATDAALFVEARIRQEGLSLVYEEPPDPYPVWADPARLRQVFVNLFDNAIKYSSPGGAIFLTLTRNRRHRDGGGPGPGLRHRAGGPRQSQTEVFQGPERRARVPASAWRWWMRSSAPWAARWASPPPWGQGTTVSVTLPVYHPGQEHLHETI